MIKKDILWVCRWVDTLKFGSKEEVTEWVLKEVGYLREHRKNSLEGLNLEKATDLEVLEHAIKKGNSFIMLKPVEEWLKEIIPNNVYGNQDANGILEYVRYKELNKRENNE